MQLDSRWRGQEGAAPPNPHRGFVDRLFLRLLLVLTVTWTVGMSAPIHANELLEDPRAVALKESRDPAAIRRQNGLIARRDRKRVANPIEFPVFGRKLRVSGRLTSDNEAEIERLLRFDLTDSVDQRLQGRRPVEDRVELNQRIEMDAFYAFSDWTAIYVALQAQWAQLVYSDFSKETQRSRYTRKEFWFYAGELFDTPAGVQVGAQRFSDDREWWWDRDLDAFRLRWDADTFSASLAVAEQLLPRDLQRDRVEGDEEGVLRVLAEGIWSLGEDHRIGVRFLHQYDHSDDYDITGTCLRAGQPFISAFFTRPCIDRDQEDESDADLTWIGGSFDGKTDLPILGRFRYWFDGAIVFGDETFYDFSGPLGPDATGRVYGRSVATIDTHDVGGVGFDLRLIWEPPVAGAPVLTGGYAFGSGRRNDINERDRGFRQTGLHDNSDKFRGVATFNYYGELFDPELANIEIWTAGLGFRFLQDSSIDFVYHHYRQHELSNEFRDVSIKRKSYSQNRDIGDEFEVILGIEEWKAFEIKAVAAVFWPGKAFGPGEGRESYLTNLRFRYNF
jgi:alginate production protein